jgi:hypothetical protein
MPVKTEEAKVRAEALFRRREQQSRDAEQVAVENSEKSRALDAKTERLKGLRLAKEAADKNAASTQPPPAKSKGGGSIKVKNLNARTTAKCQP